MRPGAWRIALVLAVALCPAFFVPAAARAAQTRELLRTFGAMGSTVVDPAPLSSPQGVGVDQSSGDVYVADTGNNRVEKFSAAGEFILAFGRDVNKTKVTGGIATQAEKDVCTAAEVEIDHAECQKGESGSAPGEFTTVQFVAVDPTTHDVYVADTGDNLVSKFSSEGVREEAWGDTTPTPNGQLAGKTTTAKTLGSIAGIAVGSTRTLYVLNTEEPGHVFEFEPTSKFIQERKLEPGPAAVAAVGLAVNAEGDLFKALPGAEIMEYDPTGAEIGFVTNEQTTSGALAIGPEGGLYFAGLSASLDHDEFNGLGEIIEPGGAPPCPVTPASECGGASDSIPVGFVGKGVGVTPAGDTVLSNASQGTEYQYGPLVIVPAVTTEAATEEAPRSVTLNGSVNPSGLALKACLFQYVEAGKYEESAPDPYAAGATAACENPDATEVGAVTGEVKVHANLAGLQPGVTYDYRLTATNENNEAAPSVGENKSVETFPPPSIDSATVSSLTASSATLNTKIDPQSTKTEYAFEYDTRPYATGEAAHGTRLPGAEPIPAGKTDVAESAPISELNASEHTYYWRVVATNESGTTTTVQHSFFYATGEAGGLPDGRAYEMVTPNRKNGALLGDVSFVGGSVPDIATDGSRVIAQAIQCFAAAQSCNAQSADSIGSPYEFTRTSAGWVTTPLAPPASEFSRGTPWAYSAQEGTALFSMPTASSGEDDLYVRKPSTGEFVDRGPDTPPEDGAQGPRGGKTTGSEQDFTPDFSHIAWDADYLWSAPFLEESEIKEVYEYAPRVGNSRPLQVGVSGGEGSPALISGCGTNLGPSAPTRTAPGTMSADGHTVFFTALTQASGAPCPPSGSSGEVPADAVYARVDGESAGAHTVAISEPSPSACGAGGAAAEVACREAEPAGAEFVGAAQDGSRAFFSSTQQLTDQASEDPNSQDDAAAAGCSATVGPNGCNLYEYEGVTAEHASEQRLVDVSEGEGGGAVAGGPRVQGVLAVAPQAAGERVYFVAKGVLSAAERPGCMAEWQAVGRGGEAACHAVAGAENLYVYSDETHSVSFITIMSAKNFEEWNEEPGRPANVTPDGRFLVFVSYGDLTSDDTSRSGARQVFRYDAQTGSLSRVSIGSGGFNDDGNRSVATPCNSSTFACSEDARIVRASRTTRPDPSMSDNGSRVFFESPVGLTAHALDDVQIGANEEGEPIYARNVYEWEAEGVGSCPSGRSAGCVFLISHGSDVSVNAGSEALCAVLGNGNSTSAVCLLGSDASGNNVFFTTTDQLVGSDTNTELDYYDARVCEPERGNPCVESPPPALQGCSGEECHGVPGGVPGVPGAPSVTFNGAGNATPAPVSTGKRPSRHEMLVKALRTCRTKHKHSKKKRMACERVAQRAYGAKKASAKKAASRKAGK